VNSSRFRVNWSRFRVNSPDDAPLSPSEMQQPTEAGKLSKMAGGIVTRCASLAAATMFTACTSVDLGRDRVVTFSPAYPKNYLIVHENASPRLFFSGKCYELAAVDKDARINIATYLRRLFAERLPALPPCHGAEATKILIEYHAGYGECVDCQSPPGSPRSGFAFFALYSGDEHIAGGEWDYWRGGTAELMAQQFVFDFTNLYINGQEKPPP
jgi:hypothetical protein